MQNVKAVRLFLLAVIFASSSAGAQPSDTSLVLGKAYERNTGEFLYNEQHFCNEQQLLCTVEYSNGAGDVFAKKTLDFSQSLVAPSLVMSAYRNQNEISIPASQGGSLVIDAGFDNFVRGSWNELKEGQHISFPFLPAGFEQPLNMKVLRSNKVECAAEQLCLEIELDSWLLALIIDPIELSYSISDKRLQHFSGISNIRDEDGQTQNVDIHYEYLEEVLTLDPFFKATTSAFNL